MKLKLLSMFCILTISCKEIDTSKQQSVPMLEKVCNCEERKNLQEFVNHQVIKAANSMSKDAKMSKVILQIEHTGINIHCRNKVIYYKDSGEMFPKIVDTTLTKLDSCDVIM